MNALTAHAPAPIVHTSAAPVAGRVALAANAVALVAVALVMRVWRLDNIPGVNGDEAWYGVQAVALASGKTIDWWTPTGNPVNVFFLFPLAALHAVFAPSIAVLRSVAAVSGILALGANYWLCRRAFDARTAAVSTVLLALLPINVAYSRFAWDASQSLLATVLVLYLPLVLFRQGRAATSFPVAGMIALAAAVLVHPTNLFAAPLLVVPILYARRQRLRRASRRLAVPAKPWLLALLAAVSVAVAYFAWQALVGAATRPRGPDALAAFGQFYLQLFSGATVYEYISGVDAAGGTLAVFAWLPAVCNLLFAAAAALGAWGMVRRLSNDFDEADASLVIAWSVMLSGFFLVAGPGAIAPHFERYGMCLIAPGAVVLSRGLGWWIEPWQAQARRAAWMLAIAAWLFPVTFYVGYFDFIERSGGESHRTFRTAPVEPKRAALDEVNTRRAGQPALVVASEWWNYWPLAYLAADESGLRVVRQRTPHADESAAAEGSAQTWYIEFAGSAAEQDVLRRAGARGGDFERRVIFDYAGRPLLSVIGPAE